MEPWQLPKSMVFLVLQWGMFDLTAAGISAAILFGFLVAILFKPKS